MLLTSLQILGNPGQNPGPGPGQIWVTPAPVGPYVCVSWEYLNHGRLKADIAFEGVQVKGSSENRYKGNIFQMLPVL